MWIYIKVFLVLKHRTIKMHGTMEVKPHTLLTSAPDMGECSAKQHFIFFTTAQDESLVPLDIKLDGPHSQSKHSDKQKTKLRHPVVATYITSTAVGLTAT